MSEHTPTPWRLATDSDEFADSVVLRDDGHLLADCNIFGPNAWGDAECAANAEFIVRACNVHDDLLAAMPTLPHPGGKLVKVVAHYESGATQTINGEVVTAAIAKATKPT